MDHDIGFLGKFFGSSANAALNIGGLISVILIVVLSAFTIWPTKEIQPLEFWKIGIPIITLFLGYAFGKRTER